MNIAKQIKHDNDLFTLRQKCIKEYINQLCEQDIYNYCEKFVNSLFEGKNINYLKNWLKIDAKLKAIRA